MSERYTRREVARMLGVEESRLAYWERLRLVRPKARWGERFYGFHDLVALRSIQQLAADRVPARRLRRAILAMQDRFGCVRAPLSAYRVESYAREVVFIPPVSDGQPFEPLTGQFVLPFSTKASADKLRVVSAHTADEWFEIGLAADVRRETLPEAVDAYRRAIELAPGWADAWINLGTALYQLSELKEARHAFDSALAIDAENGTAHFNLGCVLDDLEEYDHAIRHLQRAIEVSPHNADAHFNLALVLEKRAKTGKARKHWTSYLRLQPRGPWADYARTRLRIAESSSRRLAPIPFPGSGKSASAAPPRRDTSSGSD